MDPRGETLGGHVKRRDTMISCKRRDRCTLKGTRSQAEMTTTFVFLVKNLRIEVKVIPYPKHDHVKCYRKSKHSVKFEIW